MKLKSLAVAAMFAFSSVAFADTEPSPPDDGPVYSPPGWVCTASGGVITCVQVEETPEK